MSLHTGSDRQESAPPGPSSGSEYLWWARSLLVANLAGALVTIGFGAALLITSRSYDVRVDNLPGPGLYPRAIGWAILFLATLWLVQTALGRYRQEDDTEPAPTRDALVRGLLALVALTGFAFALIPLGYPVVAFLLVTILVVLARGSVRSALVTGIAFAALSFLLVTTGLGIQLPLGLLESSLR